MSKLKITIYNSYEEADKDILTGSLAMTPEERVATVNIIRKKVFALKDVNADNKVKKTISYAKRQTG